MPVTDIYYDWRKNLFTNLNILLKMSTKQLRQDLKLYNTPFPNITDSLLLTAFTHETGTLIHEENYQRYEFLGDSVLDMVISQMIFKRYRLSPHWMTVIRMELVENKILASYMKERGLEKYIRYGKGVLLSDGMIANVFEAIIGVLYTHFSSRHCIDTDLLLVISDWINSLWDMDTRIHDRVISHWKDIGLDPDGYYPWTKWSEGAIEIDGEAKRVRYQHSVYNDKPTRTEYKPYKDIPFTPYHLFKEKSIEEKKGILWDEIFFLREFTGNPTLLHDIYEQLVKQPTSTKLNRWKIDIYNEAIEHM